MKVVDLKVLKLKEKLGAATFAAAAAKPRATSSPDIVLQAFQATRPLNRARTRRLQRRRVRRLGGDERRAEGAVQQFRYLRLVWGVLDDR
jgi:hypothetical protein